MNNKHERVHTLMQRQNELFSRFIRTENVEERNSLYAEIQRINVEINSIYS